MPKRVDPLARRHSIAEAVFRLAAARGADAVSLRDVAGEAGVSLGMVQHYFRSKDEMLLFALDHMRDGSPAGCGPVSGTWRTPGPVTSSARYSPSCCLPTRTREAKRSSPSRSTPGRPSPPPTRPPFGPAWRACSASSPNSCAPPSTAATQDRASTPGRRPRPCSGLPTAWSGRFSSASAHRRPPSHCSTTISTGYSPDRNLQVPAGLNPRRLILGDVLALLGGLRGEVPHPAAYRTSRPVTARLMIMRWISRVPSKMVKIFASRCQRSTGKSRV